MEELDVRKEELITIEAIFSDLAIVDTSSYSGETSVPIYLESPALMCLSNSEERGMGTKISNLPPLRFCFELPSGYPYEEPPHISLSAVSFSEIETRKLCHTLLGLWQESKDQVLFTMIDFLQQKAAEYVDQQSGMILDCHGSQILFDKIKTFDQEKKQQQFDESTYTCEICQRDLKGVMCLQFDECGHVFCQCCLRDFFFSMIDAGEVEKVHCPDFECGKSALSKREKYFRLDHITQDHFDFSAFKDQIMTPPIKLDKLQRVLGPDPAGTALFDKYISIYADHQHALIAKLFPMRLVSCPRSHCPAMIFRENIQERLVVCRDCGYAFCNTCRKSFHSGSIDCTRRKDDRIYHGIAIEDIEIWIADGKSSRAGNELRCRYGHELLKKVADEYTMDRLFDEMLKAESHEFSKCPTCDIVVQRSEGCNKMRCSHCYTFFCHLCSAFLDQDHPYDHFKDRGGTCYNRLFHGMPGTEDMD